MKRLICLLLFILSFNLASLGQKEKDSIEMTIARFFDGISEINEGKLRATTTSDFILLENGHLWNMDTLVNKVTNPKIAGVKRINTFEFIKTEQDGNIAWVSYHNTADFSLNEKQQKLRWLESAVLKKEKGRWKIKLLHSTRIVEKSSTKQ